MTKQITVLLTLILSGCMGIYEGGFECPPGEGTKCKSISEVNELINRGQVAGVRASGCQESGKQGCPAISELPTTIPDLLPPVLQTSDILWNPWIDQEINDPPTRSL